MLFLVFGVFLPSFPTALQGAALLTPAPSALVFAEGHPKPSSYSESTVPGNR